MSEVKLLELPEPWQCETAMCPALYTPAQMHAYARAHLAEREREVEALRAEVEMLTKRDAEWNQTAGEEVARAERLAGALQRLVNSFPEECVLLDAGWDAAEVDEACEAYDAAHAALEQEEGK